MFGPAGASLSILAAAADVPDKPALIMQGASWSYRDLADLASARAERLTPQNGIIPVRAEISVDTAITLYAAMELATPVLLLEPNAPKQEIARLSALELEPHPGLFCICPTSGSSGPPKAALLSRRAILESARASAEMLDWQEDDRWLCCLPLSHVGGLSILTRCLLGRGTAVLVPRFRPRLLAREIDRTHTTRLSLVPTMLDCLIEELPSWRPPRHVRTVLLGGARTPPALADRARAAGYPIATAYGMTETCSHIAIDGNLLPGVDCRIEHGRIAVRGPMLFDGYAQLRGNPPAPPAVSSDGWFLTGDRGALIGGRLAVFGRHDDVIISGGNNIDPGEIEQALEELDVIQSACVFGVDSRRFGQEVAAAIVRRRPVQKDELAAAIAARIAPHKRPRRIAVLPSLPQLESGKTDQKAVKLIALPLLAPIIYPHVDVAPDLTGRSSGKPPQRPLP